jgi:hypothetical protein
MQQLYRGCYQWHTHLLGIEIHTTLDLDPKSECLNVKLVPCIRGNVAVSRKARKEIENLFGKTNLKLIKNDK